MPADLYTRIVANAYRVIGASPADDATTLRNKADRAILRARVGMPPADRDDGLPAVPAELATEPNLRAALGRLLAPATRLEERFFALPVSEASSPQARAHAHALRCSVGGASACLAEAWREAARDGSYWARLASLDHAVVQACGDGESERGRMVNAVTESLVAAMPALLRNGAYDQFAAYASTVRELGSAEAMRQVLADMGSLVRAGAGAALRALAPGAPTATPEYVLQHILPMWAVLDRGPDDEGREAIRRRTLDRVLSILEAGLAAEAPPPALFEAADAGRPFLSGVDSFSRYDRIEATIARMRRRALAPPARGGVARRAVRGGICEHCGPAVFADEICLSCLEAARVTRNAAANAPLREFFEIVGGLFAAAAILVAVFTGIAETLLWWGLMLWIAYQGFRWFWSIAKAYPVLGYAALGVVVVAATLWMANRQYAPPRDERIWREAAKKAARTLPDDAAALYLGRRAQQRKALSERRREDEFESRTLRDDDVGIADDVTPDDLTEESAGAPEDPYGESAAAGEEGAW